MARRREGSALLFLHALVLLSVTASRPAGAQSIVTAAGGGTDDGRPALAATLTEPQDATFDAAGNLYVADAGNNRVVRIPAATGRVETVAGNGVFAFAGDGGPAVAASLAFPTGVAVSPSGDLYVADRENNRVRRVSLRTGVIETVAGGGSGGDGGPAASALLRGPTGLAFDAAGNLYVAEKYLHRVRRIDAATGGIRTVAGTGTAGDSGDGGPATAARFNYPGNVALDAAGNLYVADSQNYRLRRVSAATGIVSTVAGDGTSGFGGDGGPASASRLSLLTDVHVEPNGDLLLSDLNNQRVRRISAATGIIQTIAGNGARATTGDGGPATAASLDLPYAVARDAAGNLFVPEWGSGRVRRIAAGTGTISTFAGEGRAGTAVRPSPPSSRGRRVSPSMPPATSTSPTSRASASGRSRPPPA